MSELSKICLVVLGLLCLFGGVYQAVEIWPAKGCGATDNICIANELSRETDELLELHRLQAAKDFAGIAALESASQQRKLAKAMAPAQRKLAIYWVASGIVAWIVLWGFAAIIGELMRIRLALHQPPNLRAEP